MSRAKLSSTINLQRIERQRDVIYHRQATRRIRTMNAAARFIDSVGFCLLFASTQAIELPSLFEAVKGRRDARIDEWDADSDRVWVWKNDLPATRRAYYGKGLLGKPMFISLEMLPPILALTATDDFEQAYRRGSVSYEAKRVHDALLSLGPTPTMALRLSTGLDNTRYHHALDELQKCFIILPVGAMNERGAWTSQIFDLLARWFPREYARAQKIDSDEALRIVVKHYIDTTIVTTVPAMARLFGVSTERVRQVVNALIARRVLVGQDHWVFKYGN
jgi:hypothetical protein